MDNVARTKLVLEYIANHSVDLLEPHIHEDIVLDVVFPAANVPAMMRGKATFMAGMRMLDHHFKKLVVTPTEIYDCPETQAVVFEAVSTGELVNGMPYVNEYFMTFIFRDAKIWHWREGFNPVLRRSDIATLFHGT